MFDSLLAARGFKVVLSKDRIPAETHFVNLKEWNLWGFGPALLSASDTDAAAMKQYKSLLHYLFCELSEEQGCSESSMSSEEWSDWIIQENVDGARAGRRWLQGADGEDIGENDSSDPPGVV